MTQEILLEEVRDAQTAFDFVLQEIRKQGVPSRVAVAANSPVAGACKYRHTGKDRVLKCGIGHLIMDDEYDPKMEGRAVNNAIIEHCAVLKTVQRATRNSDKRHFLAELQQAHDFAEEERFLPDFERRMHNLAVEFGLTYRSPK